MWCVKPVLYFNFTQSFINPGTVAWVSKPKPHGGMKHVTEVAGFVLPYVSELKWLNLYVEPIGCCWKSVKTTKWCSHPSSGSSFHWSSLRWLPNNKKNNFTSWNDVHDTVESPFLPDPLLLLFSFFLFGVFCSCPRFHFPRKKSFFSWDKKISF